MITFICRSQDKLIVANSVTSVHALTPQIGAVMVGMIRKSYWIIFLYNTVLIYV